MKRIILSLLVLGSLAHAEHRANLLGPVYDQNHKLLQPGDRAIGLACYSYNKKNHPELIDNPAAVRDYVENELLRGAEKILVPYLLNDDHLVVLYAPYRVVPVDPQLERFVSVHRPSVAMRAAEFALGVITLGTLEPSSPYQVREQYESCVLVEGTFDNRSAYQKMRDYFSK